MQRDRHRIVIVGAATGIGAAGARALARAGWQVALVDVADDPRHAVAAEIDAPSAVADASCPRRLPAALAARAGDLARDHAADGIRVNALCPGYVDTPFNAPIWETFGGRDAFLTQLSETIPLGRMLTAGEVAEQAVFLLSDAGALMTGQVLAVDGAELIA